MSEKEKKEQTRMGIIGGIISSFFKGLFNFLRALQQVQGKVSGK